MAGPGIWNSRVTTLRFNIGSDFAEGRQVQDRILAEIEKHRFDLLTRRYKSVREHLEGVYHARAISHGNRSRDDRE